MKRKWLIFLLTCLFLGCTSSVPPIYNDKEFDTANYQKNVDNAVDAADMLSDFDQSKIPAANLDPSDISNLVQADLYYNQGDYVSAFPFYNVLALKYKDPRIIYKAIICLEHVSVTPAQTKNLNDLVNLFIQTDADSKLAKLFQIKVAINNNDLTLAKNDLDSLIKNKENKPRVVFLFVSSMVSNDVIPTAYPTLISFAQYAVAKYGEYPEAHLVALLAYSVSNNADLLSGQVNFINSHYPNWVIPLYWCSDILLRNKHIETLIAILQPIVEVPNPDNVLQTIYVAALLNDNQADRAKTYLISQQNGANRNNVLLDLGIIYARNNDYVNALNYLNQFKPSGDPTQLQILALTKGAIYDYQKQTASAIAQYQQVNSDPLASIANVMLLNAYLTQGNFIAVNSLLDKFARENKMNEEQAILFKSSYYLGEEQYKPAYDLVVSKLSVYEKDPNYLYQYAAISGMMNYTKQSISLYKKYLKQNPGTSYGYNDLAYVYADQTTDYKSAKKYADIAYKQTPSDPNVLDTLGWVYYKMGDYTKALSYIKTSYEANYDPETAKHLVSVYLAMNRQDLAKNVIVLTKSQLQQQLKQQIIQKAVSLLSSIQFGIEVK